MNSIELNNRNSSKIVTISIEKSRLEIELLNGLFQTPTKVQQDDSDNLMVGGRLSKVQDPYFVIKRTATNMNSGGNCSIGIKERRIDKVERK